MTEVGRSRRHVYSEPKIANLSRALRRVSDSTCEWLLSRGGPAAADVGGRNHWRNARRKRRASKVPQQIEKLKWCYAPVRKRQGISDGWCNSLGYAFAFWQTCQRARTLRPRHQHGALGLANDPLRDAAKQYLAKARAAVGANHDEVGVFLLGQLDYHVVSLAGQR